MQGEAYSQYRSSGSLLSLSQVMYTVMGSQQDTLLQT